MTSKDGSHLKNFCAQIFHGDICLFLDVYISIKVGTEESE